MTPTNDFAALVDKLESEIDNVLATECIYGALSQESGGARSQRDDARAALLAYGAGVERDAERWRAVRDHFVGCEVTEGRYEGFALFGIPKGVGGFGSPLSEDSNIDHYADQLITTRPTEARES